MERTESARLVGVISGAFPGRQITEDTVRVYHALLEDLNFEIAAKAVKEVLKTARFFPTVAEIREMYHSLEAEARRARALPVAHLPELSADDRREGLKLIREYASKIGLEVPAA